MTTQISTQTISFNNQALITFEQNGTYYTAMKPICENIGLEWGSQYNRIKRDDVLSSVIFIMKTTGNDGKDYQMICLPIEYLNGWLFGIDVNRCKPEIRETLIKYKKECYQALHDYWFKGKAERQPSLPLISAEKFIDIRICESDIRELAWIWFAGQQMSDFIGNLIRPLELLGSTDAPRAYSYANEYGNLLSGSIDLIEQLTKGIHFDNPTPLKRLKQAKEHREHRRKMVLNSREMVERATQNTRLGKR